MCLCKHSAKKKKIQIFCGPQPEATRDFKWLLSFSISNVVSENFTVHSHVLMATDHLKPWTTTSCFFNCTFARLLTSQTVIITDLSGQILHCMSKYWLHSMLIDTLWFSDQLLSFLKIKLHIFDWSFIVSHLRPTCALIMQFNSHFFKATPVWWIMTCSQTRIEKRRKKVWNI